MRGPFEGPLFIFDIINPMIKNLLVLMFLVPFLYSCGSVQKLPMARFTTPETSGIGMTRVETGVVKAVRLQPSPDLRAASVSDEPVIEDSYAMFFKPAFGLADSMDVDMYFGPSQAMQFGLKFQLWGAPASSAGAGNFSVAFRVAYALYVAAEEINAGEVYSTPRLDRSLVVDSGYNTVELVTGYRVGANFLVFLGLFRDDGRYNLKFKEGVRNTIIHEMRTFGQNFALQFQSGNLLAMLNGAGGKLEIVNRNREENFFNWGLSLGLLF